MMLVLFDPLMAQAISTYWRWARFSQFYHIKIKVKTAKPITTFTKRYDLGAGYILYGTSTMLAMTLGKGVVMFSLDPVTNTFVQVMDMRANLA